MLQIEELIGESSIPMARIAVDGLITMANRHFAMFVGRHLTEVMGHHITEFIEELESEKGGPKKHTPLLNHHRTFFTRARHAHANKLCSCGYVHETRIHDSRGTPTCSVIIISQKSDAGWLSSEMLRGLTQRQLQVLDLLMAGLHNKEIAHVLAINQRTVEAHRAALMKRTHTSTLLQLAILIGHGAENEH